MRHDFRTYAQTRPTFPNHRCKHTHKNARNCIDMLCLSASSDSLLMTAVAKMAAMPACWGRSWISECRAAGYAGSSFTRTLWVWVPEDWSAVEQDSVARSASPLDSSCVSLQNNAPPVKQTVTVRVSSNTVVNVKGACGSVLVLYPDCRWCSLTPWGLRSQQSFWASSLPPHTPETLQASKHTQRERETRSAVQF